ITFSGSGDIRIAERSGSPSGVFIALALFTWAITAVAVAPRRRPASDSRAFVVRVSPVFSAAMNVLRLDIGGIAAPPYSYIPHARPVASRWRQESRGQSHTAGTNNHTPESPLALE